MIIIGGGFMMADGFYELYCEEVEKNEKLMKENKQLKGQVRSLSSQVNYLIDNQDKIIERKVNRQMNRITDVFENRIAVLQKKVDGINSILNNDSTNSGLPTSKTPLNRKKHIPNSREKTGNKKGGQPNHKKHKLERFRDEDITDYVDHRIESCIQCGSPMNPGNIFAVKDECDFQIVVRRIRHRFIESVCPNCGNKERIAIPRELKEANQYGAGVQNLILTLLNEGYVSMNRTSEIVTGLTDGVISPSNGYVAKLQKRLSDSLNEFNRELKKEVIRLPVVYWDDTVISINRKNACLSDARMKISGQFENITNARYYANIKSYLETGKRNGYNVSELIKRALEGKYITISEMKTRCAVRRLISTSCFSSYLNYLDCE